MPSLVDRRGLACMTGGLVEYTVHVAPAGGIIGLLWGKVDVCCTFSVTTSGRAFGLLIMTAIFGPTATTRQWHQAHVVVLIDSCLIFRHDVPSEGVQERAGKWNCVLASRELHSCSSSSNSAIPGAILSLSCMLRCFSDARTPLMFLF
jgi:hypothetical protein